MKAPASEKFAWRLVNVLMLLTACALFTLAMSSCSTFEQARRKYATSVVDTTYLTIRQVVPHDSAVLKLITDTTTVYREIRQGRARIVYQRDPRTTLIRADCDSVIIEKKVPQYIYKQVWGVDPVFKTRLERWRTATFVLLGLIGAATVAYIFTHRYKLKVSKR